MGICPLVRERKMKSKDRKLRNPIIELMRFFAALIVFFYHQSYFFGSGWLFVEFFLILTGYFTARHFLTRDITDPDEILPYTFRKYRSIFPCILVSLTGMSIFYLTSGRLSGLYQTFIYLIFFLGNLLGINGTGIIPDRFQISPDYNTGHMINGHLWYIEAMIIMLPVFILLCMKLRKKIGNMLFYLLPLFIHGFIIASYGTLNGWHEPIWLFLDLRAMAGLLLGGAVYELSVTLEKAETTKTEQFLLTAAEYVSLAAALFLITTKDVPMEWLTVGLFVIALSVEFSGKSSVKMKPNSLCQFLGTLSLPVYCFQGLAYQICHRFFLDSSLPMVWRIFICLMILSCSYCGLSSMVRRFRMRKGNGND